MIGWRLVETDRLRANDAPGWPLGYLLSWKSRCNRPERVGPMDRVRRAVPGVFPERAMRIAGHACWRVGPVCGEAVVRRARKLAVGCVAAGTFVAGIVLAWYLFRPGVLASVGTAQLLLLIGLFTLPFVALAAWEFERRARHAAPVARGRESMSTADRVADEVSHDFAGEVAVGDDEVMAADAVEEAVGRAATGASIGAGAAHDESLAPEHSAPVSGENMLVVEPVVEVARELLERAGREPEHDDSPRHRHPAHPRRRAPEGVS